MPSEQKTWTENMTNAHFEGLSRDKSKFFIVVLALRANVSPWCMDLEYTHYVPDTKRNDDFQFYQSKWQDMHWFVIGIPKEDRHLAEAMAKKYHLRIKDGIPTVLHGDNVSHYPLRGENVWSIENTDQKMTRDEERQRCEEIQEKFNDRVKSFANKNLHAEIIELVYSDLRPIPKETPKKFCPACKHGSLLIRRNDKTYVLEEIGRCNLCGQVVRYKDIEVLRSAEEMIDDFLKSTRK